MSKSFLHRAGKRRNVVRMAGLYLSARVVVRRGTLPVSRCAGLVMKTSALSPTSRPNRPGAHLQLGLFEPTPAGLCRRGTLAPESIAPQTALRMNRMIIAATGARAGYFAVDKFALPRRGTAPTTFAIGCQHQIDRSASI